MPSTVCQQHDAVNQKSTRIHTFTLALPCTAAYQSSDCGSVSGDWEELAKTCAVTGHVRKQAVPKHFRTPLLAADEHFSERLSSSGLARNKNPTQEASQSVHQFDTFTRTCTERQTDRQIYWLDSARYIKKHSYAHTHRHPGHPQMQGHMCIYVRMYVRRQAGRQAGRKGRCVGSQVRVCMHVRMYVCRNGEASPNPPPPPPPMVPPLHPHMLMAPLWPVVWCARALLCGLCSPPHPLWCGVVWRAWVV